MFSAPFHIVACHNPLIHARERLNGARRYLFFLTFVVYSPASLFECLAFIFFSQILAGKVGHLSESNGIPHIDFIPRKWCISLRVTCKDLQRRVISALTVVALHRKQWKSRATQAHNFRGVKVRMLRATGIFCRELRETFSLLLMKRLYCVNHFLEWENAHLKKKKKAT